MKIKQLTLHNFRSYFDCSVAGLAEGCNIIVGRNGHGKSNLHIALLFLFTDSHQAGANARRELLSETRGNDGELWVEAVVVDDRLPSIEGETLLKKHLAADGSVSFFINSREVKDTEFYNLLEMVGLRRTQPLNFLLQGKVKRVAQTDARGLFQMLAEVVGSSQYEQRKGESLELMETVTLDEKKATDLLEEFREKLGELEVDKEDYARYEENLQAGNRIYHTLYSRKIEHKTKKLRDFEKTLSDMQSRVVKLRTDVQGTEEEVARSKGLLGEKEKEVEEAERDVMEIQGKIRHAENKVVTLDSQIGPLELESQASEADLNRQQTDLQNKRAKVGDQLKNERAKLTTKQADLASRKIFVDHFAAAGTGADAKTLKQIAESKVQQLEANNKSRRGQIKEEQKMLEHYRAELAAKQKLLTASKQAAEKQSSQLSTAATQFKMAENNRNAAVADSLNQKYGLAGSKGKLLELEQEVTDLRRKVEVGGQTVDFAGINRLMEEVRRKDLEGVYGVFAQLVTINRDVMFAVEAMGKAKLYSFVVRDEKVAEDLAELNKSIRGPRIQIYPLTWVADSEENSEYPSDGEAIVLEHHVKPLDAFEEIGLPKLIREILRGCLLVKNYDEAQRIAKKFECSCVTMEGQVVYSGGFLAQVGFTDVKKGKLATYIELQSRQHELQQSRKQVDKIQTAIESQKAKEQEAISKANELKVEIERLKIAVSSHQADATELEKACIQLTKLIAELEASITRLDQEAVGLDKEIHEMKTSNSINGVKLDKFDEKKMADAGKAIDKLNQEVRALSELVTEKEAELAKLDHQLESLRSQLREVSNKEAAGRRMELDLIKGEKVQTSSILGKLKTYLDQRSSARAAAKQAAEKNRQAMAHAEEILRKTKDQLERLQLELQQHNQSRFDLQIGIEDFNSKLAVLNVDSDDKELSKLRRLTDKELIQQLQRLMLTKLKYTEKDKANFQRLEEYFKSHNEFKSELKDLKVSKKVFLDMISNLILNRNHR